MGATGVYPVNHAVGGLYHTSVDSPLPSAYHTLIISLFCGFIYCKRICYYTIQASHIY